MTPASRADVAAVAELLEARIGADAEIGAESGTVSTVQVERRQACCPRSSASSTTAGIELAEFALRKASLDEVFLALTGHRPRRQRHGEPTRAAPRN